MRLSRDLLAWRAAAVAVIPFQFGPGHDDDDLRRKPLPFEGQPTPREDLPYRVELWDAAKQSVEQVLAVTANASIGYAAYYAATREHPTRYITLRHKGGIVSRWNGPDH
jgi:hypothetical protein